MAELTADTPPTTGAASEGFGTAGYRNYVLMALLMVYIFNFIDRTIVNILTEPIKLSFGLEDWQMGMLGGPAFAVLYTFLGIPIARSAERYNRVIIIATAVAIWSLFTALCGFAMSFLMLFLFRVGVSIGEAGCTPPAQSLIADYFKPSRRATAVSIYALGVPLGGMFASIFGGQLAGLDGADFGAWINSIGLGFLFGSLDWSQVEGWRIAFVVVGVPGLLLSLIVWRTIKEPPRGYTDPAALQGLEKAGFGEAMRVLWRKPAYRHVVFGAMLASFVGYGVGQFTTSFLIRTHGLSIQMASLLFGIILGVMAAIGVFSSGWLADRMSQRYPKALSWLPALGMAASVPLYAFGFLVGDLWLAMPALMIAAMIHYYYLGPMYAVSGGVVDSRMRATSVAITLFVVNLLGYGLGPPLIGILSTFLKTVFLDGYGLGLTLEACRPLLALGADARAVLASGEADSLAACASADARGLQWSIVIFICGYGWAALHYLLAGRTLQDDMVANTHS
ncbi:MFS transporter [Parasphingopyxis sp. CP4]|uniref:spinster family MFS transporter n=1 Tax=Parasphingopyxis sp. CP4 TaxID=2724527 RepID=UPI0015A01E76|nr:MFS transporter [Parasphingopyxis sp. CP4]QLC22411.1 MFS transporter [Parasphingopyxis sp. CP4]